MDLREKQENAKKKCFSLHETFYRYACYYIDGKKKNAYEMENFQLFTHKHYPSIFKNIINFVNVTAVTCNPNT